MWKLRISVFLENKKIRHGFVHETVSLTCDALTQSGYASAALRKKE